MADKSITTNKMLAAQRQIYASIQHYKDDQYECAITLAHAAENVIPTTERTFFHTLKEFFGKNVDNNAFANWLKHPSGPDKATISELEVIAMIVRAISRFSAHAGGITESMMKFRDAAEETIKDGK